MNQLVFEILDKHSGAIIVHAASQSITSQQAYRLSIVKMYVFLVNAVKDDFDDEQALEEFETHIEFVLGEAENRQDFGIETIYKAVSDILEEHEQALEALKEPLIEEEWETAEAEHEENLREMAQLQALAGWHHVRA